MTTILETKADLRNVRHEPGLQFRCAECGIAKDVQITGGSGYGYNDDDRPVCYECCGKLDRERMTRDGRATLYLTRGESGAGAELTNWPGTLRFAVSYVRKGRHNIARVRYDVRFTGPDGRPWVGTQYGDNTQICHCRRVKD